jgi:hypothetical protein
MLGYYIFFVVLVLAAEIPNKKRPVRLFFLWLTLFVFSAIRYGMSYDYPMYVSTILSDYTHKEQIPALLELLAHYSDFPQLFFILSSFYICTFWVLSIKEMTRADSLAIFLYVGLPIYFIADLSTVRQGMSISTILYLITILSKEYQYKKPIKNKKFKIILLLLVAFLCHSAAAICTCFLLPLDKLKKQTLWVILLITSVLGGIIAPILLHFILSNIGGYLALKMEEYMTTEMEGHTLTRALYYIITIFSLLNYDRLVKKNPRNKFFIPLLSIGCCFVGLFWINAHMGARMCAFYSVPIVFVLIDLVSIYKVYRWIVKSVCVAFFLLSIYICDKTVRMDSENTRNIFIPFTTMFSDNATYNFKF